MQLGDERVSGALSSTHKVQGLNPIGSAHELGFEPADRRQVKHQTLAPFWHYGCQAPWSTLAFHQDPADVVNHLLPLL